MSTARLACALGEQTPSPSLTPVAVFSLGWALVASRSLSSLPVLLVSLVQLTLHGLAPRGQLGVPPQATTLEPWNWSLGGQRVRGNTSLGHSKL